MPDQALDKNDYVATLLRLGQMLNSSLDLSQVLHTAIEQVVEFVGAERGFILLMEEGTKKVWGKATRGIDPLSLENTLSGRDPLNKPEISRTIVEQTLRDRVAVLSLNAMEDPRFEAHTSVRLSQVRSVLCVPLITQGQSLGIVYLDNRAKAGLFDERQSEMLSAFANQAAVAIQNARLFENLRKSSEERLRLQQELLKNEMERLALEEANRFKTEFLGFVSHELRNPLTTIRGYVQTLSADTEETLGRDTRLEFYETVEAEADRMLAMINELLDASRLEANRPLTLNARPLNIAQLLEKLARSQRFYKFWTPKHEMVTDFAADLPEIEGDEDKLHQILANLLSNAIKYSPDGGKITFSAYPVEDGVRITIADQGVGMTDEQKKKLFQKYERVDREDIKAIPGTGLGLYLTRHLIDLHGGIISVDSAPGEGSRFSLFIPLKAPEL